MRLEGVSRQDSWKRTGGHSFYCTHIEGITLVAGEEVDEVAGGASGMGVDGIGEVGDRASEGMSYINCSVVVLL